MAIVAIGILLPISPFAAMLGFVPLPLGYFAFLVVTISIYLTLVEIVKRKLMVRLLI